MLPGMNSILMKSWIHLDIVLLDWWLQCVLRSEARLHNGFLTALNMELYEVPPTSRSLSYMDASGACRSECTSEVDWRKTQLKLIFKFNSVYDGAFLLDLDGGRSTTDKWTM